MYNQVLSYITVPFSINCKNVKKKLVIILYLEYASFIWRKLDGCIYMRLSYYSQIKIM